MDEKEDQKTKQDGGDQPGLVEEGDVPPPTDNFEVELERTLKETEQAVLGLEAISSDPDQTKAWSRAREVVAQFRPVPWFIWRLSNFVIGSSGSSGEVTEGLVFGMRRLLFAAASDPLLGTGEKVNRVRKALSVLSGDVVAAVSVIHAVCRRLGGKPHERIWRPILDDALLRARLGYSVGSYCSDFGAGRGMLAGFSGRAGLAILIASGELEDAQRALELLATGDTVRDVGMSVYECDPLHVSAMVLTAGGCGRDASFGTVSYASESPLQVVSNEEQLQWLAAFVITENVRVGSPEHVADEFWEALELTDEAKQKELNEEAKKAIRRGHGWPWLGA